MPTAGRAACVGARRLRPNASAGDQKPALSTPTRLPQNVASFDNPERLGTSMRDPVV